MCGRFTLTLPDATSLARALGAVIDAESAALYRPRYNVAPSDLHPILRSRSRAGGPGRELVVARWGLVNHWQTGARPARCPINARSETLRTSRAFRGAFERRRCVVPADGFFEWTGPKSARRPIWFHRPDGGLLHLAGLYESWQPGEADGPRERTFTVLTTAANDVVAEVHDRMPVVLRTEQLDRWLDDERAGPDLVDWLAPTPHDALVGREVSPRVSAVKNDDPTCLEPASQLLSLFGPKGP
jgi:putative SOS response-associated peptidase YedK